MEQLRGRRILAAMLCLCMALAVMPVARAENDDLKEELNPGVIVERNGTAQLTFKLSNKHTEGTAIRLLQFTPNYNGIITGVSQLPDISGTILRSGESTSWIFITFNINPKAIQTLHSGEGTVYYEVGTISN